MDASNRTFVESRGIRMALGLVGLSDVSEEICERLAQNCSSAISETTGSAALARVGGKILYFNIPQAILACAGTLASGAVAVAQPTLVSVLAALAAISSFRGTTVTLSIAQAIICQLLIKAPSHAVRRQELQSEFIMEADQRYHESSSADFDEALSALANLGCIDEADGFVFLKQQVLIALN